MNAIPTTWSFSRWSTWSTCPLQYKLKFVDKLPDPPSPAMARGDAIHKSLARHIDGKLGEPLHEAVVDPFHKQLIAEMLTIESKMVEQQWGFGTNWKPTGWFGKTTWLRSICDVALLYRDDSAEVIDWKTGKVYGSNADQMELFALTTMMRFGPNTTGGVKTRLIYLDARQEQEERFAYVDLDRLRAKWQRRADDMLNDRQFMPRPNDKCKFCNFSRSKGGPCRFG